MKTTGISRAESQAIAQVERIVEMVKALEDAEYEAQSAKGDDSEVIKKRDDAQQVIHESPLSVEVRSDWRSPGAKEDRPCEYKILLCTGGLPAVRIVGELNKYNEPENARVEYQDWGTPWTEHWIESDKQSQAVLTYVRQFYFGG